MIKQPMTKVEDYFLVYAYLQRKIDLCSNPLNKISLLMKQKLIIDSLRLNDDTTKGDLIK